ncbi:MAG: hypothetical protein ABH829_02525 [archaeon]
MALEILGGLLVFVGIIVVSFILGSVPLYLALKVITMGATKGGKGLTFYKVLSVNLIGMVIVTASTFLLDAVGTPLIGLLSFFALLGVYKFGFGISWSGALVAWLLQLIIAVMLSIIAVALVGMSIFV